MIRHVFGVCGVLAACVLLLVSAAMNWRFGYSLGRSEFDGLIYASASVAADCLKALVPFFLFSAIRNRAWSQAATAAIVGVVVTAYSLTSALGHAALNRNETSGHRIVEAQAYTALKSDLKRAQDQLSWIPQHRPPASVGAEMDSMKTQRLWTSTDGCKQVDIRAARTFCQKYQALVGEMEYGKKAETTEARIAEVQSSLGKLHATAASSDADPQAAVLAKLFGLDVDRVQFGLIIFVAVLLEVGSGMGLYMAFSQWRIDERKPSIVDERPALKVIEHCEMERNSEPPAVVTAVPSRGANDDLVLADTDTRKFFDASVDRHEGQSVSATSLYDVYRVWCHQNETVPLALPVFAREIGELGIEKVKRKQGVWYVGIRVRSAQDEIKKSG